MQGSSRGLWLFLAGLFFVAIAAWGLSSPLFSYPDEAAHVIRAESVVRGQVLGTYVGYHEGPYVYPYYSVRAPGLLAQAPEHGTCLAFETGRSASACPSSLSGPSALVAMRTYVGAYPPAYYFVVGLPSLAWPGTFGIFLMRVLSGALCAGFLASAVLSALGARRGRVAAAGVLAALTPTALYLSGGVSPAGLEICCAISLWAAGLALVTTDTGEHTGRLVRRVGLAAGVLVWTRGPSPFWLGCILVALLLLTDRSRRQVLRRRSDVRVWSLAVGVLTAGALVWDFAADAFQVMGKAEPHTTSNLSLLGQAFGRAWTWFQSIFGDFGDVDHERAPTLLLALCVAVLVTLMIGGFMVATRRQAQVLASLIAASILVPVVVTFADDRKLGMFWQGRYVLPLAAGVPILAASVLANSGRLERRSSDRWVLLVYVALFFANVTGMVTSLRRFVDGDKAPLDLLHGTWQPPVNAVVFLLVFAGAQAALVWTLYSWGRAMVPNAGAPESGEDSPAGLDDSAVAGGVISENVLDRAP